MKMSQFWLLVGHLQVMSHDPPVYSSSLHGTINVYPLPHWLFVSLVNIVPSKMSQDSGSSADKCLSIKMNN